MGRCAVDEVEAHEDASAEMARADTANRGEDINDERRIRDDEDSEEIDREICEEIDWEVREEAKRAEAGETVGRVDVCTGTLKESEVDTNVLPNCEPAWRDESGGDDCVGVPGSSVKTVLKIGVNTGRGSGGDKEEYVDGIQSRENEDAGDENDCNAGRIIDIQA